MNTLLLRPEDAGAIEQAGALLAAGQVVGIPTETVYGLGANALNDAAVRQIFAAKGRPADTRSSSISQTSTRFTAWWRRSRRRPAAWLTPIGPAP